MGDRLTRDHQTFLQIAVLVAICIEGNGVTATITPRPWGLRIDRIDGMYLHFEKKSRRLTRGDQKSDRSIVTGLEAINVATGEVHTTKALRVYRGRGWRDRLVGDLLAEIQR